MPKIYFASGKIIEFGYDEVNDIVAKMKEGGTRLMRVANQGFIPLNSSTIEFVEILPKQIPIPAEFAAPVLVAKEIEPIVEETKVPDYIDPVATFENEPKIESAVEKEQRILQEIIKKSDCKHEGTTKVYRQQTVKGDKYFHKCSFCGWKGRFVKASSLTADELSKAEIYRGE